MIDWTRIDELREEVGEDAFEEVLEIFLEETAEAMERLRASAPGGLAEDLHFLKGSAQNVGMTALGAACAEQEAEVRSGARTQADVARLESALDAARSEIASRR